MSKLFTKYYDTFMRPLEEKAFSDIRRQLVKNATGFVIEIGSGTGANLPFYVDASNVTAIEPNDAMREKSLTKLHNTTTPIKLVDGNAECLPFPDDMFDSAVATLVFCTIVHPEQALKELRRVCKKNAPILFLEHVRIDGLPGRIQDFLTPFWKRLCDGCCLNRNTLSLIEDAGFDVKQVTKYYHDIFITVDARNRKYTEPQ